MSKRTARIEIHPVDIIDLPPSQRPHYLRLVAANGETLAHSEAYASRSKARRGVSAWLKAFGEVWYSRATDPGVVHEFDASGERTR